MDAAPGISTTGISATAISATGRNDRRNARSGNSLPLLGCIAAAAMSSMLSLAMLGGGPVMSTVAVAIAAAAVLAAVVSAIVLHCRNRALNGENRRLARVAAESWAAAESARDDLVRQQRRFEAASGELAEARDAALAANRTKSSFLANMSHELRTPLNAIIGFADVIEQEMGGQFESDDQLDLIRDIRASGQHLLSVINDILDMSKIAAGKMELREGTADLIQLIDSCVRMMRPRSETAAVDLVFDHAGSRPLRIRADELRLKQAVINLLSNAVKFTPAGGAVTVSVHDTASPDVVIRIEDTGIGMRPVDIEVALAPFRQLENSFNRSHEGTGLGLPLSKALVEMHGGRLEIASRPGAGTRVSIILPGVAAERSPVGLQGALQAGPPLCPSLCDDGRESPPDPGAVAAWLFRPPAQRAGGGLA